MPLNDALLPGQLNDAVLEPRTPLEGDLAAIWNQALGVNKAGVEVTS